MSLLAYKQWAVVLICVFWQCEGCGEGYGLSGGIISSPVGSSLSTLSLSCKY